MNKLEFETKLKELCPWVDDRVFEKFEVYKNNLQEYNSKFNLTRLAKDDIIYEKYFLASLLPYIKLNEFQFDSCFSILDVGTGSGIPGVVLKIIFPNLRVTLLDSNQKKCDFLKILLDKLHFIDVELVCDRCENFAHKRREFYDYATSRAVASLVEILELSVAFIKVKGKIISCKSLSFPQELKDAQWLIPQVYLYIEKNIDYEFGNNYYVVSTFVKNQETPSFFPRSWNKIKKK